MSGDEESIGAFLRRVFHLEMEEGLGLEEGAVQRAVEDAEKSLQERSDNQGVLLKRALMEIRKSLSKRCVFFPLFCLSPC
jgi:hypothetical protein